MPEELGFSLQDGFFGFLGGFQDSFHETATSLGSADGRLRDPSKQIQKDTEELGEIAATLVGEYKSYRQL